MSGQLQQVACPHCGCSVNNDASFAGRSVVCPACRGRFQMPPLLPVAQPIPPVTHEDPAPPLTANSSYKPLQSRPRPRLSRLALKSVLFAIPGLCCFPLGLVGFVLGITAYFRINDKRNNEYGLPFALSGVGLGVTSLLILAVALGALRDKGRHPSSARDTTRHTSSARNITRPTSSARSRVEANAWKDVDSSSEATRQSLKLVQSELTKQLQDSASGRIGGVYYHVTEGAGIISKEDRIRATYLGKQRYEVGGAFLCNLRQGGLGRNATSLYQDGFQGIVVQRERDKWEFETVKFGKNSYKTREPVIPKVPSDSIGPAIGATELAPSGGEIKIAAVADTMVATHTREGNPIDASSMNFGRDREMASGRHSSGFYEREIYIRFDLSAITARATSAKLRLNLAKKGNSISQYVALVSDDSWRESAVTWDSKPRSGKVLASWTQRSGWIEADVTEAVQSEVVDNQLSLRIYTDSENGNVTYHSREAIDETVRPKLIVTTITSSLPISDSETSTPAPRTFSDNRPEWRRRGFDSEADYDEAKYINDVHGQSFDDTRWQQKLLRKLGVD